MPLTIIISLLIVHYTTVYLNHHDLISPLLTQSVSFTGMVYCVDNVNKGLSTVFGYSHCQHCSNIYLLLVIPIAVAGLVSVLLLFILNLTVTDGDINGFILCINIISINYCIFFPQCNIGNYINVFVSLANLDLGVPTCFYNGMDDYAKMWLQLAFPAYLIFIATLLIITSRHSTTVQRITACRSSTSTCYTIPFILY